jgi:RNA polymerase sigma-70 factor (ECF subfamily)
METVKKSSVEKDKYISVIREHQKLIYKICHTYCADPESREDLQQEILMQLWQSFRKFDGRVKISTWIYRIALNTAISFYRNHRRHHDHRISWDASVISLAESEPGLEKEEQIRLLYQFIGQLNELDKALMLLYLDDKSYSEIADILGISETNAATKVNRIKGRLKEKFINH